MMDTDEVPISGLDDLEGHLQRLVDFPNTPLNAKLLDDVELQLTGNPALKLQISFGG